MNIDGNKGAELAKRILDIANEGQYNLFDAFIALGFFGCYVKMETPLCQKHNFMACLEEGIDKFEIALLQEEGDG